MKHPIHLFSGALLLGALSLTAPVAKAQTTTVTSAAATTPSMGTISDFSPDVISVRTESAASPVTYHYSKTTTYVDEMGNPVSVETVKSGLPVTVYYTQDGDSMVASKVVVRKATTAVPTAVEEKTTTTTTTSEQ